MTPKHLLLTGYRGCGKSAVGRRLAESLAYGFVDTDVEIEASSERSIAELFADVGQEGFRNLESIQISNLFARNEPAVISLGGGAILRPGNRECIRKLGKTVWLQAEPQTIFDRISKDATTQARRPKLSKLGDMDEIRSILESRIPWYKEVANFSIPTDGQSLENLVDSILYWFSNAS